VGAFSYLPGFAAVIAVPTFLAGSPLWNVDRVGELTPTITGSPPAVVNHLGLHHAQGIAEKNPSLSTENKFGFTIL